MSYFIVVQGPQPTTGEMGGVRVIPVAQDQPYVRDVVHRLFPKWRDDVTWSVVDVDGNLIPDMGADIQCGKPFDQTRFGRVIIGCMNQESEVFVWWADVVDQGQPIFAITSPRIMIDTIINQQASTGDVCAWYKPG